MVFIENETALLCVTMREHAMTFAATIYVEPFDIAFAIKKFSLVHFLNAFWHVNETFPKGSS